MIHSEETKKKISEASLGERNPSAKTWLFSNVDGKKIKITGKFKQFCEEHNLSYKIMRNIAYKMRKGSFYNGWTVRLFYEDDQI